MAEFDLIPKDYARSQALRRWVKWFALVVALIVAFVALARLGLALAIRSESGELARLRSQDAIAAQAKASADAYRQQKQLAEKQLRALDELRGRDRVRLFLHAMDAAYLNGIWFDEIRYFRGETVATGNLNALPGGANSGIIVMPKESQPGADAAARAGGIEQHVGLFGHALNHSLVAQFMRALGSQPGIADVRLQDTGLRAYTTATVIDFKLSLQVDDKAGSRQ